MNGLESWLQLWVAFTLDVKVSVKNENLGGILDGTQCWPCLPKAKDR